MFLLCFYLHQGECSEHWRRLRNWSFCALFCVCFSVCVYMYFEVPYLYNGAR